MNKKKLTVQDYAELCKVSRETIYNRIECGDIIPESFMGVFLIDIEKFPAKGAQNPGRKSKSH